ncbi:MAG TPA: alpha/beta fold hydrolase, partial [Abditibacteriaceae bacterium]
NRRESFKTVKLKDYVLAEVNPRVLLRTGWQIGRPKSALVHQQKDAKPLPADCPRHVVLIHGHNCLPDFMNGVQRSLRQVPGSEEWRFWHIEYDTHWKPFTRSAREVAAALKASGQNFEDVILVGHSMGGLICRQMVAYGFPCRALFALGSPHLGYVPWLPFAEAGSLSISMYSRRLQNLNRNPRDRAARKNYHFFAADYTDPLGYHAHDCLVTKRSALGTTLGPVGSRIEVHLSYKIPPIVDPHVRMLHRENLGEVLAAFEKVIATQ